MVNTSTLSSFALILIMVSLLTQPTSAAPISFPPVQSTVLPDPSFAFTSNLLSTPLPTNSFFQNFALQGDLPDYFHPYIIKPSLSSLSISYPTFSYSSDLVSQQFEPDLTISDAASASSQTSTPIGIPYHPNNTASGRHYIISDFNDLSVTLDFPSSNLRFYLVRGSPFITCTVSRPTAISISTTKTILSSSSSDSNTKHTVKLANSQTWLIYTSAPLDLTDTPSMLTSSEFSGVIRIAVLPDADPKSEDILNHFSSCYPTSGATVLQKPYTIGYRWEKNGPGDLLMLAHPLHLQLLSNATATTVLEDFKYKSIDGDLVGVVGDSWELQPKPIPVSWHSVGGIEQDLYPEIVSALRQDVQALNSASVTTTSSYFYGKLVARAARLALIAEEVACLDVLPTIKQFLMNMIEPWLDGTFSGNGFMYDDKWGGLVTVQGATDSSADFGFGIYNDHHFHLGYFVYGISVLAKIDPDWGRKYKPQAYSLVEDYINKGKQANPNYPRLRSFDLYKLHSWAGGLTAFNDGGNQESSSESINGYYAAALMGKAYGDIQLEATGSLLVALEIQAAQMWWHVREDSKIYEETFTSNNRMVGVLWATKRDTGLWFAPKEAKEIRLGIQMLPITPITEVLFSDIDFARQLVNWTLPALNRPEGVTDGWKGFVYSTQGIYDKQGALENVRSLNGFDDGNSLTNLLWWIHSRN